MNEKLGGVLGVLLGTVFGLGDVATFFYLMWEDWPGLAHFGTVLVLLVLNGILAQIWPIYWLLIRPIMGP